MNITENSQQGIELETADDPDACVIWLHGLGADASDFVPVVPELRLPASFRVRFIFPNAPVIPITINQGFRMRGWYDITSMEIGDREEDADGIAASSDRIVTLIEKQIAGGIASERIVIAGFSQGGAIALHAALQSPSALAGVMALSTYLPRCAGLDEHTGRVLNVFMAHGTEDEIVKYQYGKMSKDALISHEHAVKWHIYDMGHSVCNDEISDISSWLQQTLS